MNQMSQILKKTEYLEDLGLFLDYQDEEALAASKNHFLPCGFPKLNIMDLFFDLIYGISKVEVF